MSMEMYILSDRRLASVEAWQQAIDAEGFDLRLLDDGPIDRLRGHLPARWKERPAGFECYHDDADELIAACPDIDFGRRWSYVLALRWGADLSACHAAGMAACAYARATDGVVFETEAGVIMSPAEAAAHVRETEKLLPSVEAVLQRMAQGNK
jgi:hypothetical protein